jgi:hypothetical protein
MSMRYCAQNVLHRATDTSVMIATRLGTVRHIRLSVRMATGYGESVVCRVVNISGCPLAVLRLVNDLLLC